MSLKVGQLDITQFRGYEKLKLSSLQHLNVLVGENAVGKTNIVEAIQLLTSGESFRKPAWSEVISWGCEAACIKVELQGDGRSLEHKMTVANNTRKYEVNGKKKSSQGIRGTCPSVLFIPDHLQMVKAASAARRDAVDSLAMQLSKNYATLRQDYNQSLKQRNLLIKEEVHAGPLFDSWDESACINGARLCVNRQKLFARLAEHMRSIFSSLVAAEELECIYIPSWARFDEQGRQRSDISTAEEAHELVDGAGELDVDATQAKLTQASKNLSAQELQRKTSLIGPHKDEIAFYINGRNARTFASQGQQRTIVLAFKLAEVELVREFSGTDPVLLLDDVMSELDSSRRDALTSFIERSAQTFITTTNLGYFSQELLEGSHIIELPIENTKIRY